MRKEKTSQSQPPSLLFSGRLHGLRVVRVVWVQQVLRQRTHHSDPHDQTGAPVWGHPLSRDHPEEEVQDPEVPKQSQGGERRRGEGRGRKEKETRQTERGSGRGAARFVQVIRFIYCFKLLHKLIYNWFASCWLVFPRQVAGCSRGAAGQTVPNRAGEASRSVSWMWRKERKVPPWPAARTARRSAPVTFIPARGRHRAAEDGARSC